MNAKDVLIYLALLLAFVITYVVFVSSGFSPFVAFGMAVATIWILLSAYKKIKRISEARK